MKLPSGLAEAVLTGLEDHFGQMVSLRSATPIGGGCIHSATRLDTSAGPFFLKYNRASEHGNFVAERRGLGRLHQAGELRIPEPYAVGMNGSHAYFVMELLEAGPRSPRFWTDFGAGLARLHQHVQPDYGLDHDNFIGRLPQSNTPHPGWTDFFIHERLLPQLRRAEQAQLAPSDLRKGFEALFPRLEGLLPEAPASLLHGDLWSGNFMTGPAGTAAIFDPAVFYGHREAEIAFTRLFGGFSGEFYRSYNEVWPLESGWQERVDLFNLYPLMVHLNLFGRSYLPQVQSILAAYR